MKNILVFVVMLTATYTGNSQSLIGAWEAVIDNHSGRQKVVVVFSENHQSASKYDFNSGAFLSTNGGTYTLSGTTVTEVVEFDSNSPERVGSEVSFEIELEDDAMTIKDIDVIWKRIDDGKGPLSGAWLISGRMRNGELRKRETSGPRKTMKILSGTRFQWIAYNTETKEFMGTGGGTYTAEDGKYTENIEFFSRDDSRVGATLQFDFALKEGDWHHSGLSSKGQPIYEVWSLRE